MKQQPLLTGELQAGELLEGMLQTCEKLFVKKLSLNDRDWARFSGKHQAGVYIPAHARSGGFFPALSIKVRDDPASGTIREVFFDIDWQEVGEIRNARLVHYTSKGPETHLTRLPKTAFQQLSPASLLVIGIDKEKKYRGLTLDSTGTDYEYLTDFLGIRPDFVCEIFTLRDIQHERKEEVLSFIDEVIHAFRKGSLVNLAARYSNMPTTAELAAAARALFLASNELDTLDPFAMDNPGDALREISRGIEYEIFRDLQTKAKALEIIRIVLGDDPGSYTAESAIRAILLEFPRIDALLLSAAQQRKSRAGYSFEHHIEAMLIAGNCPYEKQVVIEAKKRPDFILPTLELYKDPSRTKAEALVLSAKTTLRERWKQVQQEIKNCDLYLATVDENIAANAIEDMAEQGIRLVVPESLKNSSTTEYKKQSSVLSFKAFFELDIKKSRLPIWISRGIIDPA